MSRDPARLFFSIVMIESRMVFSEYVGIVEKVENGCVYTIQENSGV